MKKQKRLGGGFDDDLTVSEAPTIYGCCGLFDLCGDADLLSLSMEGTSQFLDWIGWEKTDVCLIKKYFITWVRPEGSEGRTSGRVTDPCGDAYGVEWGKCDFVLEDFGRLRRKGPVRDVTKINLRYCDAQPRYRLDGSPIKDDIEFDMRMAAEGLLQDLKREIVSGNAATPGSFDGLEQLVITGYTGSDGHKCSIMDSIVIDWNGNDLGGGSGITWNGAAVGDTYDFVDVLLAIFRRIMDRIRMTPVIADNNPAGTDMVLVGPSHFLRCLLNFYTCWSVCPGGEYNPVVLLTYEARKFRDALMGGTFGAGKISLDGTTIQLLPYEWGLVKGPTLSDVYLLTGSVGGIKFINGQYNDMSKVPSTAPQTPYSYTDGGRILTWPFTVGTCYERFIEMQPRLLMWAPWAQVRIQDVKCVQPGGVISPDPWETSFFPETSFNPNECADPSLSVEQYL